MLKTFNIILFNIGSLQALCKKEKELKIKKSEDIQKNANGQMEIRQMA